METKEIISSNKRVRETPPGILRLDFGKPRCLSAEFKFHPVSIIFLNFIRFIFVEFRLNSNVHTFEKYSTFILEIKNLRFMQTIFSNYIQ